MANHDVTIPQPAIGTTDTDESGSSNGPGQQFQALPAAEKPYYSKRAHKKSRAGCKNCKGRRVKCDEARPKCRNCVVRRLDCIYANSLLPPPSVLTDQLGCAGIRGGGGPA